MDERYIIGPDYEPDYDSMWSDILSLDDAAREAVERTASERANSAPATEIDYPAAYLDSQALFRVIGMLSVGAGDRDAADVARTINLRQAASETPADFVKRVALALLGQMAGME